MAKTRKGSVAAEHQNLWGKFPWQQLWCMYAEKMAELDLYFAEDARRVLERIDADHVGIGASLKGFGLLADMEIEFSQRNIHWFMLDVHPAQDTICIRYLLRNKLIRVRHVVTLASRWFTDTHYGTTDAIIRPSDPAISGRLLAEALLNDEERRAFWDKVYEKRKDWTEH